VEKKKDEMNSFFLLKTRNIFKKMNYFYKKVQNGDLIHLIHNPVKKQSIIASNP